MAASTLPDASKATALAHSRCVLSASSSVTGVTTAGAAGAASALPGAVSADEEGATGPAVDEDAGAEGTSPSRSTFELLPAVLTARGSIAGGGRGGGGGRAIKAALWTVVRVSPPPFFRLYHFSIMA